jgi:hypothetical protein
MPLWQSHGCSLELRQFLAQAYHLKSITDYGLGPDTDVPLDPAGAAIDPPNNSSTGARR